jgi:hypothetical protein
MIREDGTYWMLDLQRLVYFVKVDALSPILRWLADYVTIKGAKYDAIVLSRSAARAFDQVEFAKVMDYGYHGLGKKTTGVLSKVQSLQPQRAIYASNATDG